MIRERFLTPKGASSRRFSQRIAAWMSMWITVASFGMQAGKVDAMQAFAYLTAPRPDSFVLQFKQGADGTLQPLQPARVGGGSWQEQPSAATVNGEFLYECSMGADGISEYHVGNDGRLLCIGHVPLKEDNYAAIVVTPDSKFVYVADSDDSTVTGYRVGEDGRLHALANVRQSPGPHPFSMAIDRTGHYLFVGVLNLTDPISTESYIRRYTIGASGALTTDISAIYSKGVITYPGALICDYATGYVYLSYSTGISVFHVGLDGSLSCIDNGLSRMVQVAGGQIFVDHAYSFLIGVGSRVNGGSGEIDVWRQKADGSLSDPTYELLGDDGLLYATKGELPEGKGAVITKIALDTAKQILYVVDGANDRIFRYIVRPDGTLALRVPYQSLGTTVVYPAGSFLIVHRN